MSATEVLVELSDTELSQLEGRPEEATAYEVLRFAHTVREVRQRAEAASQKMLAQQERLDHELTGTRRTLAEARESLSAQSAETERWKREYDEVNTRWSTLVRESDRKAHMYQQEEGRLMAQVRELKAKLDKIAALVA